MTTSRVEYYYGTTSLPSNTFLFISSKQDFYNLVDVYLDAVFFPKCVEDFQTFQQEGWHYELNDPSDEITFKGSPISLLSHFFFLFLSCDNFFFLCLY